MLRTCCVLTSGTGFVAPADLPLSDEEDVEQAVFACLFAWLPVSHSRDVASLKFLILVVLMLCSAVQVQSAPAQASSQRHVGFGQETEGYSILFNYSKVFHGFSSRSDV